MKKIMLLLAVSFLLFSCKKDSVDATNLKTFQSSINDMATRLNTIQQIKFNEALYILKTFGVDAEGDVHELNALSKLIAGKKVPEILTLADQVAQQNGIDWSSTGPPSLGEMNIFGDEKATERDPNDITANSLEIITNPIAVDSILGPKALQVIPRLTDRTGNPVDFESAMLETVMEVASNGVTLMTSKNLMQNNDFTGFTVRYASLPKEKLLDDKIDVTVSVKTKAKTFKMTKVGIQVNPKALPQPQVDVKPVEQPTDQPPANDDPVISDPANPGAPAAGDPKVTVQRFLNNISSQNLRGAYDVSDNPSWGSYETFSNPTSGFGSVKNLNVKNISTGNAGAGTASVNATYDVTDKNGNTSALKVTFGLKNVNGVWKISSYRIN